MAVKKRLANEFYNLFLRGQTLKLFIFQLVVFLIIGSATLLSNIEIEANFFVIILIFLFISSIIISFTIIKKTAQPTKVLIAASLSMSEEMTDIAPPNPNEKKYQQSGLGDAIQTIYELSSKNTAKLISNKSGDIASEALSNSKFGLVALNDKRQIVYAAPIKIDPQGKQQISLLFNDNAGLDTWLDECSEKSVHAEHIWTRIPDRLPNEENRRFFDIIASYHKGAKVETILSLIDRTENYKVDEEGLDFIAFAAHELRGPITVIRGYLDILQDELSSQLAGDQVELFKRLVVSANRLSGYIDNILNTSRYDRRHLIVHLGEGKISNVYDTIKDDMELRASSQGRILNVNLPDDLPTVAVDIASMSEVLGNLIDNALKYSNEGGVVSVSAKTNGSFVDVMIQDNGIGMPESVVNQLFQKFYRSHRSRETVAGTGIGLYISKAIVESHGGNISVSSQEGHGSTFTISIPIYATVADKLKTDNNSNQGIIKEGNGWIKNHSMYRG